MKLNKKLKQKIPNHTSSSSEEQEWMPSQSTEDEINEESGRPVGLCPPDNLIPGDFVIVKYENSEKKKPYIYRYVATILTAISTEEFEIQCLKSANLEKTCFTYIENDISTINIVDAVGKLPEPTLFEKGRVLQNKFSGAVDVFEKKIANFGRRLFT